ncbi:hypothetical protein [Azospirillum argentinense]|uniref:Uncharacterized protein n=1 Tax=Azospirillum brasilense TaxID=192 RepID=A0A4D8QEP1_AZOBR|nr:hypothetical protein [Azospirillum argentinense]QCO07333.1 hypothetical protein D3867_36240 [Azospirillum argentinense]
MLDVSITEVFGGCACEGCRQTRSIKLEGVAIDAARRLDANHDAIAQQIKALFDQVKDLIGQGKADADVLWEIIKHETGTEGMKGLRLDTDYLTDHGIAFLHVPITDASADTTEQDAEPASQDVGAVETAETPAAAAD